MRRRPFLISVLVLAAGSAVIVGRIDARRRKLVGELRAARARAGAPDSAAPTDARTAPMSAARRAAGNGFETEIAAARAEIAGLERSAVAKRREIIAESDRRLANLDARPDGTDPEEALTKLERFRNVGRDTPAHAVQTLVWAALKGDEPAVETALVLDPRAARRADALLAGLPEPTRVEQSPERLAALWFEGTVVDVPAAQIVSTTRLDADHATVVVRGGIADTSTWSLVRDDGGWVVVVPQHALEVIQKQVRGP